MKSFQFSVFSFLYKKNYVSLWTVDYRLWTTLLFLSIIQFSTTLAQGTVTVNAPENFEVLIANYKKQQELKASIPGYRIHVISNRDRDEVNKLKAKIYSEFPDMKPFMSYHAPNFKLRVGNYFYKIDAFRDLQKISASFPGTFIVNEDLKWNEF
jgi:hypothetical protein